MISVRAAGVCFATAAVLTPVALHGQGPGTAESVTTAFAERWAEPGSAGLLDILDPAGVLLAFEGREHRDLDRSKLLATVDEVRKGMVGGGVRLLRVVPVAGSDDRAFSELIWEAVTDGTSESVEHTVYLGLIQHGDRWWVNEIRLLR